MVHGMWFRGFNRIRGKYTVDMTPTSSEVIRKITDHREELARYSVRSLSVFGSVARGVAAPGSDVDLLVEFDRSVGLFHFIRLKLFLESVLGVKVDLVTPDALKVAVRDQIMRDAIRAA